MAENTCHKAFTHARRLEHNAILSAIYRDILGAFWNAIAAVRPICSDQPQQFVSTRTVTFQNTTTDNSANKDRNYASQTTYTKIRIINSSEKRRRLV